MSSVEVEDLRVVYHSHPADVVAVDSVSFTADAGRVTVVLGPNGAGKTTTMECCEGFLTPTSGAIRVAGLDPRRDHARAVAKMGVMPQGGGLQSGIRPVEALRQFAAFYDHPRDPAELLAMVGLDHRRRVPWVRLSGGEQQRLSLALALIGRPEVLFLDEPSAGVDVEGRLLMRDLVAELAADGVCVILTTHDLDEAERLAHRIVILDRGRVVANGPTEELLSHGADDHVLFTAAAGLDTASLSDDLGSPISETRPGEYRVAAGGSPPLVARLTAILAQHDILLGDLRAGRKRLDDVFLRLTREESTAASARSGVDRRRQRRSGARGSEQ